MGFKQTIRNLFNREWREKKLKKYRSKREFKRISKYPRFTHGYAYVFDKRFKFHDNLSFIDTYRELFLNDIYRFNPSGTANVILDCGANMGLSVIYFARTYPNHTVVAFEPDEEIFKVLQENVKTFDLPNVTLIQKAVWDKVEQLEFYTDKGMGGRVNVNYAGQKPQIVETIPLTDFLSEKVDFLKIDIEGAEDPVLKGCSGNLGKVHHIFFEYHNNVQSSQTLDELLKLMKGEGFHYYIKESGVRKRPFIDNELICEKFDMAINVFCYKHTVLPGT